MKQIVLVGFMGAGKTTIGRQLAQHLQLPLIDTDHLIEARTGKSIPELFSIHGEEHFRVIEAQVLDSLADTEGIISTGGGIVLKDSSRLKLKQFQSVVYLSVPIEDLITRIKKDHENPRPLFLNHSEQAFREIYQSRIPLYEDVATVIIENSGKDPQSLTKEIIEKVGV